MEQPQPIGFRSAPEERLSDDDTTLQDFSSPLSQSHMKSSPTSPAKLDPTLPSFWTPRSYVTSVTNESGQLRYILKRRLHITFLVSFVVVAFWCLLGVSWKIQGNLAKYTKSSGLESSNSSSYPSTHSSKLWLQENSGDIQAIGKPTTNFRSRPKAAIISLVRNEELEGIKQSMSELELHWNHKYQYPWVFFNDKPFDNDFKVGAPVACRYS